MNCRDYDFVGFINPTANTNAKSFQWFINTVQVTGATKVYSGDSLRYRFHRFGRYAIRLEMAAGGAWTETKYDTVKKDTVNFLNDNLSEIHRLASKSGGDFYEDLESHFSLIRRLQTLKAEPFATAAV